LAALKRLEAFSPPAGVSSIEDESHNCVHEVEEENLQFERNNRLLQQEFTDLCGANAALPVRNRAQEQEQEQEQEMDILHK
jgi:hypothetical protein